MSSPEKEIIFEVNRMITEDTTNLWTIAIGLTAIEIAIICHLVHTKRRPFTRNGTAIALSLAAFANLLSIAFGFFAQNGLIKSMLDYTSGSSSEWHFNKTVEWLNFLQMISMTVGGVTFLFIFVSYSRILAEAMVRIGGKDG